eukprot:CAMPEP_0113670082 /NCGR_PEP_ID=MMETSP0038_2-20120614/4938_1 /TAXON_ID=2898 /ORGANISM="Cryptomonas paramecium" /LENGTH=175 /DNA_ID=CAMNT_0000586057 /DNA_START=27 /DNA_END=550 /DNA_ORIENTATION=- /assembly_acc=CAM_ASM_000170
MSAAGQAADSAVSGRDAGQHDASIWLAPHHGRSNGAPHADSADPVETKSNRCSCFQFVWRRRDRPQGSTREQVRHGTAKPDHKTLARAAFDHADNANGNGHLKGTNDPIDLAARVQALEVTISALTEDNAALRDMLSRQSRHEVHGDSFDASGPGVSSSPFFPATPAPPFSAPLP